jgi:hypothetical protein
MTEIPETVRRVIERVAQRCEVEPATVLKPHRRVAGEVRARSIAMQAVAELTVDGKPRYGLDQIARWFGVSRNRLHAYRTRAEGYQPRRVHKNLSAGA